MKLSRERLESICSRYYVENAVEELVGMFEHIDQIAPLNTVLEIGVCFGGSMHLWEEAVPVGDGLVIGVEYSPKVLDRLVGREAESRSGKRNDYVVEWQDGNVIKLASSREMYVVIGDSSNPAVAVQVEELLGGRKIDFWFHDGQHFGPIPVYDYHNFCHLIREDALVCVADTNDLTDPKQLVENGGAQALALELPEPKDLKVQGHRQGMVVWRKQDSWKLDPAAVVKKHRLAIDGPNAGYSHDPKDYTYPGPR